MNCLDGRVASKRQIPAVPQAVVLGISLESGKGIRDGLERDDIPFIKTPDGLRELSGICASIQYEVDFKFLEYPSAKARASDNSNNPSLFSYRFNS